MDYFYLKIFHFLIFLKKDRDGAKWSALLFTALYATSLIILFICLISLKFENFIGSILKRNPMAFTLTVGVICPILLALRYYRNKKVEILEKSLTGMKKGKQIIIDLLIYMTLVILPLLTFILFRLYVIGHLKWW